MFVYQERLHDLLLLECRHAYFWECHGTNCRGHVIAQLRLKIQNVSLEILNNMLFRIINQLSRY